MIFRSLFNAPFKNEKRVFLLFGLASAISPIFRFYVCSYLREFAFGTSYADGVTYVVYTWVFLFFYIHIRARHEIPLTLKTKYALSVLYFKAVFSWNRISLQLVAALIRLSVALKALLIRIKPQFKPKHKVLSADASRAAKSSSRYKNLLKPYE